MPMGAVTAFYGLDQCISILHGSQGCSTYIRRHMATHYNEPVDIASSSLTEHGTVYGGEKNLITGLENLIRLYSPKVIGVATTCLAETIGEDVDKIIKEFYRQHPESQVKLIPVATGGYMGTQYEGYFSAVYSIVKYTEMKPEKNNKINVITGPLSPADTRYLKSLLDAFELDYVLLPDISKSLDGGFTTSYSRLPKSDTTIEDVKDMGGARITLELTSFMEERMSVGFYLHEKYGVPYERLDLPVGMKATDLLIKRLAQLSGKKVPKNLIEERKRVLDAMIDSHKHNAEGRVAIFGEPDFAYGMANLCLENGIMPRVIAVGTKCKELKQKLEEKVAALAEKLHIKEYLIVDETDFEDIQRHCLTYNVNMMIGSSDARRIEDKTGIPLVRCAFPVHDRIGGQRIKTIGYTGGIGLLDQFTNTLLEQKESGFRRHLYDTYYKEEKQVSEAVQSKVAVIAQEDKINEINEKAGGDETMVETSAGAIVETKKKATVTLEEKKRTHPCFSCDAAHKYARIHLPIAPKCNIQCNYCVRKFDCVNESRPGVTTKVLNPEEAIQRYIEVKKDIPQLRVVGIAGPGDALANFKETKATLEGILEVDPDVTFCLSTNGLMLPLYASELVELGVSHVTVTMNAVDPKIGAQIYKHIRYMGVTYTGEQAASILLANQLTGLKYLTQRGIVCKVNIVTLRGINEDHIEEVVKKVKEIGVTITNIMQLIPVKGSGFENLPLVSNKDITALREKCGQHLAQMTHCKQCRADAIGMLDKDQSLKYTDKKEQKSPVKGNIGFLEGPVRFAAASKSGMIIDQHFGHAEEFYIYDYIGGVAVFKEKRSVSKYCTGKENCGEEDKIGNILKMIEDCQGVLTVRIGTQPQKRLQEKGIEVFTTYEYIEKAVEKAGATFAKAEAL
jgi:nitrogenase molybdenum-iron protein alpha/beta subunit/MoaA/NifB/PqqE/SkfB family radical SAM enzyme